MFMFDKNILLIFIKKIFKKYLKKEKERVEKKILTEDEFIDLYYKDDDIPEEKISYIKKTDSFI